MRIIFSLLAICAAAAGGTSLLLDAPPRATAKKNPYEGDERAAQAGRKLYGRQCAACHGKDGQGIGKRPPLASESVQAAPAGAIEWVIRNGSVRGGMPSFSHLPEPQRWQIVTYVKTLAPPGPNHSP